MLLLFLCHYSVNRCFSGSYVRPIDDVTYRTTGDRNYQQQFTLTSRLAPQISMHSLPYVLCIYRQSIYDNYSAVDNDRRRLRPEADLRMLSTSGHRGGQKGEGGHAATHARECRAACSILCFISSMMPR